MTASILTALMLFNVDSKLTILPLSSLAFCCHIGTDPHLHSIMHMTPTAPFSMTERKITHHHHHSASTISAESARSEHRTAAAASVQVETCHVAEQTSGNQVHKVTVHRYRHTSNVLQNNQMREGQRCSTLPSVASRKGPHAPHPT